MRAIYLFLVVIGLTKAVPMEVLTKLDLDSIKEALTIFNEDNIKETVNNLYVDQFKDSVTKLNLELKEHFVDSNNRNNGPIETIILGLLESVRDILLSGTDTIPVLDPLAIDRIHIGDEILPSPSYITINDLTVKNISTFEVPELKFTSNLFRQRLDFDIVIPAVSITTNSYDLSLSIFGGHIFGKGNMDLKITKPRVNGHAIIGMRITGDGIRVVIQQCRVQISLASFEPEITGLFNDQTLSDFVAAFLRTLVPELFEFFEEDLTNIVSSAVLEIGNLILADLDIGDILPTS